MTYQPLKACHPIVQHSHMNFLMGGVFHHFTNLVLCSRQYKKFLKNIEEGIASDCSIQTLRIEWNNESVRLIHCYPDSLLFYRLKAHPLIWLLKMICWNPKVCCVPIGELASFDEFFGIYTIEVSVLF